MATLSAKSLSDPRSQVERGAEDAPLDILPATDGGAVWVEIEGIRACQRCARGQGCGSAILDLQSSALHLLCQSDVPVRESQRVTVYINEQDSRWLWFVAGAYGLPLSGLLAGAMLGTAISALAVSQAGTAGLPSETLLTLARNPSVIMQDVIVASSAVLGLVGGLFAWRTISRRLRSWVERGLCLDSARIVAIGAASLETVV